MIERQQIVEKVALLNQKLKVSGIPQLCFEFDFEGDLVQLIYKFNGYNEWIGSIVDATSSEILNWLEVQETQFYLYKQLISYFGSGFAHAIIPNDSSVELTLKSITYYFRYDEGSLVVTAYKHCVGKDLTKQGSKLGELLLERVNLPHSKKALATKVSITRVCHETEVAEHLDYIQGTFKHFEEIVVNQTN